MNIAERQRILAAVEKIERIGDIELLDGIGTRVKALEDKLKPGQPGRPRKKAKAAGDDAKVNGAAAS